MPAAEEARPAIAYTIQRTQSYISFYAPPTHAGASDCVSGVRYVNQVGWMRVDRRVLFYN